MGQGPDTDSAADVDGFLGNRESLSFSANLPPMHDMHAKVPLSAQHAPVESQAD